MTATSGAPLTAAMLNMFVRDNLNETAPAKATVAGRWFVTSGKGALAERAIASHTITASETTTSDTFKDMATIGPTVTVTTSTRALVFWRSSMNNASAGNYCITAPSVSGATTIAASDAVATVGDSSTTNDIYAIGSYVLFDELTPGSNTFTLQYRVQGSTGTFSRRHMFVMAM